MRGVVALAVVKKNCDVVDISNDISELEIECQSNGYNPNQKTEIKMVPSLDDLRKEVKKCKEGKKNICVITVTCSAKNALNDKERVKKSLFRLTRAGKMTNFLVGLILLKITEF